MNKNRTAMNKIRNNEYLTAPEIWKHYQEGQIEHVHPNTHPDNIKEPHLDIIQLEVASDITSLSSKKIRYVITEDINQTPVCMRTR